MLFRSLVWHHADLLQWAKTLADDALSDSSPEVLAATLQLATAIGKYELDWASDFMARACAATPIPIMATRHGRYLMSYVWSEEVKLKSVLQLALNSASSVAIEQAGFWATVGSIQQGIYAELAAQSVSGPPAARAGVVRALITIAQQAEEHRRACLERFMTFLNDQIGRAHV